MNQQDIRARLRGPGLGLRTGPFTWRIRSDIDEVAAGIGQLYGSRLSAELPFADYEIEVARPRTIRRWLRRQCVFRCEGVNPFLPLPVDQGLPFLEWGLNYAISMHAHHLLTIHAAVLERGGRALLMPGSPGAGKSTLAASLAYAGWRLLSDELALIRFDDGTLEPLARPISLKNASIGIMRRRLPDAFFSPEVHDTAKGTISLLRAPEDSIRRETERAMPAWIVFPRWEAGAPAAFAPRAKALTFIDLAQNSHNYTIHDRAGFEAATRLIEQCECLVFRYGDIDEALALFARLADGEAPS